MLINYGSFMYCAYIFLVILVCAILYFILKNRSNGIKKATVLAVTLLNFLQHIFKLSIYPQYAGSSSVYLTSAYNVCAFLILASPFILLFGNSLLKNFIAYAGSFAGMIAMLVPYWFIGKSAFTWEAYRFYICHGLLFISSMLPSLLGLYELKLRHCWRIGLLFFGALFVILLNDAILIKLGYYPECAPDDILAGLNKINPCWSMHPSAAMPWVEEVIAAFSPSFFLGENPWNTYIPILWYALPLYIGMTVVVYLLFMISRIFARKQR